MNEESSEVTEVRCSGVKNNDKRCTREGEPNHTNEEGEEMFFCFQHTKQKNGKKVKKKSSREFPMCLGKKIDGKQCSRKVNPDLHPEGYCKDHESQMDDSEDEGKKKGKRKGKKKVVKAQCKGFKADGQTQCSREIDIIKYPRGFCHDHDEKLKAAKQARGRPEVPVLSVLTGLTVRLLEDSKETSELSRDRLRDLTRLVIELAEIKQDREPTDDELVEWLCKGMSNKSGSSYTEVHKTSPTQDLNLIFGENKSKWILDLWEYYEKAKIPKKEGEISNYVFSIKEVMGKNPTQKQLELYVEEEKERSEIEEKAKPMEKERSEIEEEGFFEG